MTLIGRGTSIVDGRKWSPYKPEKYTNRADGLGDEENLVIKVYWPEESRTSEVGIPKKATEHGERWWYLRKRDACRINLSLPRRKDTTLFTPIVPLSTETLN